MMTKIVTYKLGRALLNANGMQDWFLTWNLKIGEHVWGRCNYATKTIDLSAKFCEINNDHEVKKLILHEMSHHLGARKHGQAFYACLQKLYAKYGITDKIYRQYSYSRCETAVAVPKKRNRNEIYHIACPQCGMRDSPWNNRNKTTWVTPPSWVSTNEMGEVYQWRDCYPNHKFTMARRRELCWKCHHAGQDVTMLLYKNDEVVCNHKNNHPEIYIHPFTGEQEKK
jgi:hypothetical protein